VPPAVVSGAAFTVVLHYTDTSGNVDTSFNGPVTLAIANNPGPGTLSRPGGLTVNAVDGVVTFDNLHLDRAANGYTLQALSPNLPNQLSGPLNVHASALSARAQPRSPVIGQRFNINLSALDVTGNVAGNLNGPFRARVVSRPAGAVVAGKLNGAFTGGVASLRGLTVDRAGTYRFRITINGLSTLVTIKVRGRRLS
jgi:hypothetical protein